MDKDKIAWAMKQLIEKNKELGRIPKKEDFDEVTRSRIKAFLGPWPRALEAAGLKEKKVLPEKTSKRLKRKQNKHKKAERNKPTLKSNGT